MFLSSLHFIQSFLCVICLFLDSSLYFFFFSSRRRHTRCLSDWSSDVCSSDLGGAQSFRKTERRGWETTAGFFLWQRPRRGCTRENQERQGEWRRTAHGRTRVVHLLPRWSGARSEERRGGKRENR